MSALVRIGVICLSAACLAVSGCSGDQASGRRDISGTVLLDGVPLDSGAIHFEPLDRVAENEAARHGSGGVITDGKYQLADVHGLPDGTYRVSISAPEGLDREPVMGQELPPAVERIPAKYNVQSELTVQVTSDGANTFDFQLESTGQ